MAEFQRFRVAQGRHGGGTAMFGAFRKPFREVPTQVARPSPVLGDLGRSRTGPAASGAAEGPRGPHGGLVTRRRASCGLSWVSCGSLTVHGLRSAFSDLRPAGPVGGLDGDHRLYPITKLGGRCRKFWVGCLPSFSDTVHPGAYMEKPRRHCRGLVSSMVRRPSSFLGPPSRSRRAPSQPRSS